MHIIKRLLFQDLRFSGISAISRNLLQTKKVTILMFHKPQPDFFDTAISELKKRYNIVSFEEFLKYQNGEKNALPQKALIITLDDGWKSNADLMPIIRTRQVPITIFLMGGIVNTMYHPWFSKIENQKEKKTLKTISDSARMAKLKHKGFEETHEFPERIVLNQEEIKAMQETGLVTFGSHSLFHPILPKCNDARAAKEIQLSKEKIEALTGTPCHLFSFPNGEYSERDIRLCRKAGYQAAVTLDVGFNQLGDDLFRLKRISVPDNGSISELLVKSSGLWALIKILLGKQKRKRRHAGL